MKNPEQHPLINNPGLTGPTYQQICQTLTGAADRIEKDGHCQGKMHQGSKMCLVGAICRSSVVAGIATPVQRFFEQAHSINNAIVWNDTPGRTQDEVVTALRYAAKLAADL